MRMTIDVWNELPFLVRNKLQIYGKKLNSTNDPQTLSCLGFNLLGYMEALQDAGLIEDNIEVTLLRKYVLSIGKEEQA